MKLANGNLVEDNKQYSFVLDDSVKTLLFDWKFVEGLSAADFRAGIVRFADLCKVHRPLHAVINAVELDQESPAVEWLRSQDSTAGETDYITWWALQIVPVYNDAGIKSLAVATGDPEAPGELSNLPKDVQFKVGYFPDLETSIGWRP